MKIYLDGELVDEKDAKISVFDHGLLYGDGVFEGIRIYNGRVFKLDEHLNRLYDCARAICLTIPIEMKEMEKATLDTVAANGLRDGYIRLVVTRGVGTLGLNPKQCPKASVIIIAANIKLYPQEAYDNGLKLITCATRRPAPAALSPQVKSLNYLNNIMAKLECLQAGCDEGIMLNEQGYVAAHTDGHVRRAGRHHTSRGHGHRRRGRPGAGGGVHGHALRPLHGAGDVPDRHGGGGRPRGAI
jgi:branched-chain amino acid aminotransferase